MKVDSPLTTDLGLGVQRRIIETSDSIVEVPSQISPVIESILPTQLGGFLTTTLQAASFHANSIVNLNNTGAQVNVVLATLAPGVWTITLQATFQFTIATAFSLSQVFTVNINNGTFNPFFFTQFLSPGTQGWLNTPPPVNFLLRDQCTLNYNAPATAVGDTVDAWLSLNCVKHL